MKKLLLSHAVLLDVLFGIVLSALLLGEVICFNGVVQQRPLFDRHAVTSKETTVTIRTTIRRTTGSRMSCMQSGNDASETFVLSFDGAIANTVEWRILQGIDVALATWPHLTELLGIEREKGQRKKYDNKGEQEWLVNKMMALSHVLQNRPGSTLSCDFALLARLLIEEQELDQGKSVGKSGKYASRFHPSSSQRNLQDIHSSSGSRPLTVGEISENWNDGGCLFDSLLIRYNIDGCNPLTIMKEKLDELRPEEYSSPALNSVVCDALADCSGRVYITIGHKSDLDTALKALQQSPLGLQVHTAPSLEEISEELEGKVVLIPLGSQTETSILRQIICGASPESTVFAVNSSWNTLQKSKILFGDNIPRIPNRMANANIGDSIRLSLNLPKWAENTHPSQHNDALMNPWTNLLGEAEFSEILSARIVSS